MIPIKDKYKCLMLIWIISITLQWLKTFNNVQMNE